MKWKTIKIFLILISVFYIISFCLFIKDQRTLANENRMIVGLPNTDLSTILVDTHRLGENITKIDERIFLINCENGKNFTGDSQKEDFSGCITKRIVAFWSKEGTDISYGGESITTLEKVKAKLGNNYLEGIPINEHVDTITYIDHKNNIELSFTMNDEIILKRIKDNTNRIAATPIIHSWYNPVFVIFSLVYQFKSVYLFNPYDYFLLPPYFSLLLLPFVLLFTKKDKVIIKRLLIIVVSLVIVSVLTLLFFLWNMMMGV